MKTDQVFEISGLRSLLAVLLNSTTIMEKSQTGRQNQEGKNTWFRPILPEDFLQSAHCAFHTPVERTSTCTAVVCGGV